MLRRKQRFFVHLFLLLLFGLISSYLPACSAASPTRSKSIPVEWTYTRNISQPVSASSGSIKVSIGDLNNQKVTVSLPGNTFDASTQVNLANPNSVPRIMSNQFTPLDAPVEITTGSQSRLKQPATITFKVDQAKYAKELQKGDIWVAYYDGKEWQYIMPDKSDALTGTISFNTYHFCLFGEGKIDLEERISKYTHSEAAAEIMQKEILDAAMNNVVSNALEDILLDKYHLDPDSIKSKLITSLVNDDEYGDIVRNLYPPDPKQLMEANKSLDILLGKKLVEALDSEVYEKILDKQVRAAFFKGVLSNLTSDTGLDYAGASVDVAANIIEGNHAEALRIAGEAISNSFMLTNLVRGAGQIVQGQINEWQDNEVEAAYQAYKNGADNGWWGYNVAKLDFNGLWNQMRGLSTKIESDAVQAEIARRQLVGLRAATPAELDAVRAKARQDLKNQFEAKVNKEAEIQQKEAELHKLVLIYDDAGLFNAGSYGYEDIMSVEHRLDALLKIKNKILSDTGRKGWTTSLFTNELTIGRPDLIALTQAWFSDSTGEAYARELKKRFPNAGTKQITPTTQTKTTSVTKTTVTTKTSTSVVNSTSATTSTQTQASGWYLDGSPVIYKANYPTDSCSYFGFNSSISSGSATGSQSWKDCSGSSKCSGTYNGFVTWTPPPSFMKPGSTISLSMSENTTAQNTCGSLSIGSWGSLKINGAFIINVSDSIKTPTATATYSVGTGLPGSKMVVLVSVQAANLTGSVTYNYIYK